MYNAGDEVPSKVLDEMKNVPYYKPLYHPPYSKEVTIYIVTALYIETSISLLLDKFPLPSFSLLKKLSFGGMDTSKQSGCFRETGRLVLAVPLSFMLDEMYFQKSSEYHGGSMIGQDESR